MLESLFQLAGPVQALCATLMTWALTSLGACVVFLLRKPNRNVMDAMLGLAGGVMVAASFWSLLSPSIDMAEELGMCPWSTALIGFMGGGFLLFWGDRAFTHFSQKREAAGKNGRSAGFKRCAMLVFSITLHNIPEGLAIGVAFGSLAYGLEGSTAVGAWMLAVGIGLQNLPEGMAVSLPLRREGLSPKKAFFCGQLSGIVEPIAAVLGAKLNVLKTPENFNNDIGLPRTLFRLNESYGAAVIEMGMSGLGEISVLSKAAAPDICIITNIGWCHIENLKTRENILKAKLEILDGASAEAPLILNGDDEFLKTVDIPGRKIVRYGRGDNCGVRAEDIIQTADGQEFTLVYGGKRYTAKLPVVGEHHVMNALAAFAAGIEAGMTAEEIIPAFLRYEASGMRQRIEKRGDITVILDCYNASPTSMESSLSVLGGMECSGRKCAVLGDMLELGEMSAQLHAGVAEYITKNADCAFLYGAEMANCREALERSGFEVHHSTDKAALTAELLSWLRPGDIALFKGSRGMRMEEIAEKVK